MCLEEYDPYEMAPSTLASTKRHGNDVTISGNQVKGGQSPSNSSLHPLQGIQVQQTFDTK